MKEYQRIVEEDGGDPTVAPVWYDGDTGVLYIRVSENLYYDFFSGYLDSIDLMIMGTESQRIVDEFVRDTGNEVYSAQVVPCGGNTIDMYDWIGEEN